jgi:hypothetical protein
MVSGLCCLAGPNIPMPLIACVSAGMSKITSAFFLAAACINRLGQQKRTSNVVNLINNVVLSLSIYFASWLASQQVLMVMGKGPVPTYAPPYVPVGPVVNGDIISTPGHLAC